MSIQYFMGANASRRSAAMHQWRSSEIRDGYPAADGIVIVSYDDSGNLNDQGAGPIEEGYRHYRYPSLPRWLRPLAILSVLGVIE